MDLSVSPTHGEQEKSSWNGHYDCTCHHPLFLFNQFGDMERCALRLGNVHSADDWESVLKRVSQVCASIEPWLEAEAPSNPRSGCRQPTAVLQERIGHLADAPRGTAAERGAAFLRKFHLSGRKLVETRAGSSPKLSGIRANSIRASALSSPKWRDTAERVVGVYN